MKTPAKSGQMFIITLNRNVDTVLSLLKSEIAQKFDISLDASVKILNLGEKGKKYIPVKCILENETNEASLRLLLQNIEFDIKTLPWQDSWQKLKKSTDFHMYLKDKLAPSILELIPKSFDSIGNVAILELDRWGELSEIVENKSQLQAIFESIGKSILDLHKHIKTVLRKKGSVQGEFRIREFEILAGELNTSTIHKENNLKFAIDPTKMFFSPRLSFERKRVSTLQYETGSIVMDCFAGCGPFSIQIAQNHDVHIYCTEKNPDAYEFLLKNIQLNQKLIKGEIIPKFGDFSEFHLSNEAKPCLELADYIIMNLPERSSEFLPAIRPFLKPQGSYLVYYSFIKSETPMQDALNRFYKALEVNNLEIMEEINSRIVFSYSPTQNNVVIESYIKRK